MHPVKTGHILLYVDRWRSTGSGAFSGLPLKVEWSSHSLQMLLLLGDWIHSEICSLHNSIYSSVSPQINRAYFLRPIKFLNYLIFMSLTCKMNLEMLLKESWKVVNTFLKKSHIFILKYLTSLILQVIILINFIL